MVARFSEYAALPLRFVLGALFIALGARMVFGDPDPASTTSAWAWWAGLVELVGGLALVLGVLTRWVALALALESLIFIAARASGVPVDVEFRLAALAGLVALGLMGAQRYALDTSVPALAAWSGSGLEEPARKAA